MLQTFRSIAQKHPKNAFSLPVSLVVVLIRALKSPRTITSGLLRHSVPFHHLLVISYDR